MRILYLSQYFPPEVGATQTRAYEMARGLVARGHHVTMLTEVPNHPSGIIPPAYRGKLWERCPLDGIDVIRLGVITSPHKGFRERMLFYLSYMGMAIAAGLVVGLRRRYDVIYATSPPLFAGLAGAVLNVLLRTRFVFEVRDLWPESAVALGELSSPRAIRLAEGVERFCYRRARRIVVVTQGIARRLTARGIRPGRVALIPNGANVDEFHPAPEVAAALRRDLGLGDRFVAIYAGIHGVAQGMETLVEAARLLQDTPEIVLLFVGAGPRKAAVAERAAALGLANLCLLSEQPRAAMPGYLTLAGCTIVPLARRAGLRGRAALQAVRGAGLRHAGGAERAAGRGERAAGGGGRRAGRAAREPGGAGRGDPPPARPSRRSAGDGRARAGVRGGGLLPGGAGRPPGGAAGAGGAGAAKRSAARGGGGGAGQHGDVVPAIGDLFEIRTADGDGLTAHRRTAQRGVEAAGGVRGQHPDEHRAMPGRRQPRGHGAHQPPPQPLALRLGQQVDRVHLPGIDRVLTTLRSARGEAHHVTRRVDGHDDRPGRGAIAEPVAPDLGTPGRRELRQEGVGHDAVIGGAPTGYMDFSDRLHIGTGGRAHGARAGGRAHVSPSRAAASMACSAASAAAASASPAGVAV